MGLIRARVDKVTSSVRYPHPIGVATVAGLTTQAGEGIKGHRGAIRYGEPTPGTLRKFGGYLYPPDLFVGWNPSHVARGTVQTQPGRLPASAAPSGTYSPLLAAMANLTGARGGSNLPGGG